MSDEPLTDARNLNAKAYDLYIRGELDKLVFKIVRERDEALAKIDAIKNLLETTPYPPAFAENIYAWSGNFDAYYDGCASYRQAFLNRLNEIIGK